MEITKEMIEEFKMKSSSVNVLDSDVEKLIMACGGDIDLAVKLIVDRRKEINERCAVSKHGTISQ